MITLMDEMLKLEAAAEFLEVEPQTIKRLCCRGHLKHDVQPGPMLGNRKPEPVYYISLASLCAYQQKKEREASQRAKDSGRFGYGVSSVYPELFSWVQDQAAATPICRAARPTTAPVGSLEKEVILNARLAYGLPLHLEQDNREAAAESTQVAKVKFYHELVRQNYGQA